jgi:zinc D-Ala-D-Ala carboxypeptidase
MSDSTLTLQKNLQRIGWPIAADGDYGPATAQAVADFQNGYGRGGIRLAVDGKYGPKTAAAMGLCLQENGRLSAHFYFREFASKGNGWIRVHWSLPTALEIYRAVLSPGGVTVVSGYRDPAHNRAIGGASNSQHLYGTACDLNPVATVNSVINLHQFSGIEYRSGHMVYHVDTRHAGPNNTTRSTVYNPSLFTWG